MNRLEELYKLFLKYPAVSTDTRRDTKDTIFFALSGEQFNGNIFAAKALEKGAQLAIIDDPEYDTGKDCFLVEDVLTTLQELAQLHRKNHTIPVLGITGSNGKTTTKELISVVLGSTLNIIATEGNLNNHIGVPLTILRITKDTEFAIIEMGANHIGEIDMLCNIAQPNYGMITNIGKAHLEGFGNFEGVIKAKSELYQFLGKNNGLAFVNEDDKLLVKLSAGLLKFTYGKTNANISGHCIKTNPTLELKWRTNSKDFFINSMLYGEYNLPNILAAISVGIYFQVTPDDIIQTIGNYIPKNNRSQQLKTANNRIILDAYNANPVSMTEALKSFKAFAPENAWVILGDMFELGENSEIEHDIIVKMVKELGFERALLVGKDFYKIGISSNYPAFKTTEEAFQYLSNNKITNANILIKGSRGMQLESLINCL